MDTSIKILVVDDFATMRKIIRNQLVELGFENITDAEDGTKALTILKKQEFDLVITDWNMPNMAGIDLLKKIRSSTTLCDLPVLMVTAEAKKDQILDAAKAGVNGYIIKPFKPITLKEKLVSILG